MITGIGMYGPHGYCMNFCSPLLTGGRCEWKKCIRLSGVLSFQGVHDAEPQWNVSTNASVTAAVNGWTGVNWGDRSEVHRVGRTRQGWGWRWGGCQSSSWRRSRRCLWDRLKATVPLCSSISQEQKEISLVEKIVWNFTKSAINGETTFPITYPIVWIVSSIFSENKSSNVLVPVGNINCVIPE